MHADSLLKTRQEWRKSFLQLRREMPPEARTRADAALDAQLRAALAQFAAATLAFYWPIQAEFDARPAVTAWLGEAAYQNGGDGASRRAVLPVVTRRNQPLRFRAWNPATVMQAAGFGTSVPSDGEWLTPTVLVIPLVGFDEAGYRLGYGGGYYDRTLALIAPRPQTIGIGYASGRLATIYPQAHDFKLDAVLAA
jgi:5-formyltetrahydrofolate cyclo-ligase